MASLLQAKSPGTGSAWHTYSIAPVRLRERYNLKIRSDQADNNLFRRQYGPNNTLQVHVADSWRLHPNCTSSTDLRRYNVREKKDARDQLRERGYI